jgi:hypothetical protein
MNMKKNILYALALATTMVACTDDYTDWAAPQENGPEEAKSVSVSVSPASAIDFATSTAENVAIFSASVTAEEGATATYKVTLSPEDNSASTVLASANGSVPAEELKNAVVSFYGKAPTPRVLNAVVDAYVDVKGQTVKVTAPAVKVNVTLDAPQISEKYYIIGEPSEWNPTCTTMAFNHSGANVYDDPIFTILIPAVDNDGDGAMWFAVTDDITVEKNDWTYVFGCAEGNGNNGKEGSIARRSDLTDDGSFKIDIDGSAKFIKMTLNMMDYAYKLEKINFEEYIYVPGNHQGWNPGAAPRLHGASFDGKYVGYSCLDGGFKFTKGPGWNFGEYNWGSFTSHPEGFTGEGGGDITCTVKGFYLIEADVTAGTLKATPTTWGIIGDATADGWNSDQDMTWNEEKHCWCATITLTDGTIKFRANDGWDINFGGNPANLNAGGDNIPVTAGTYDIDLYLERTTTENIYCTLTKK